MPSFKPFYPEIEPNQEFYLDVSEIHKIYVATYGNKHGIPVIFLHGGPGAGTSPDDSRFFDPRKYHIILADQRGSGKSIPKGELNENTTQHLVDDIERIREHLKITQWVVFGGSWGSTLGLVYAETHPEHVLGLVLRGIYLSRFQDSTAFTRDGCPAALSKPEEWEEFKAMTRELIIAANLTHLSLENNTMVHIYSELLNQSNLALVERACATWSRWECLNATLIVNEKELEWSGGADGINMGKTETRFLDHGCYLEHNQILANSSKLKGLPIYIVQGNHDLICPPYQAVELGMALRAVNTDNPGLIISQFTEAGHSRSEEATRHALIDSTDDLAVRLQSKMQAANPGRSQGSLFAAPMVNPTIPVQCPETLNVNSLSL